VAFISPRMADVLTGLCLGLTNAAIGRRLYVSEQTVRTHVKRLYREMGANDRTHCVALAISGQVEVRVVDNPWRKAA
jgi:DNA-binding NarL/FixJ family response regulator